MLKMDLFVCVDELNCIALADGNVCNDYSGWDSGGHDQCSSLTIPSDYINLLRSSTNHHESKYGEWKHAPPMALPRLTFILSYHTNPITHMARSL
jgi:hypothetical protein